MGKNWGILIIVISITYLAGIVYQNRKLYTEKFSPSNFEKKYYQSQWAIPNSKNIISDEDLYSYAAYRYIKGLNPILINAETPYLGKYLIGVSIAVFKNQRIMSLIIGFLSLCVIAHIVYISTKSLFVSSIAIFLTLSNSLFVDQLIHAPQLDIFQLLFFLLFTIFFLNYKKDGSKLFLFSAGLAMGYFMSTKLFLTSFAIINLTLIIFYLYKRVNLKKILTELTILNIVSLLIYTSTYIGYFMQGGTFRGFLGVQKWVFVLYQSSQIKISELVGSYLGLIFFNNWKYWTKGYPIIHYQYWSLLWPITFILGIFSAYKLVKHYKIKKNDLVSLLFSFLIVYNAFLLITPIYPRYLLLLFVPLNIFIALYISKLVQNYFSDFKF